MSATDELDTRHEAGHQVAALGVAVVLSLVVFDQLVNHELGVIFDIGFVGLCLWLALDVRPRDFFVVGVLPPLMMLGVFILLAISSPGVLGRAADGPLQAVVTGLAQHSVALLVGYATALAALLVRRSRA